MRTRHRNRKSRLTHTVTPSQPATDSVDGTHDGVPFDSIERAISDIAAGKAIIVVDNEDRENEGDLIFAADAATPALMGFLVRYSSGYVCVALQGSDCDRLGLPPMVKNNTDPHGTAYTVTCDAAEGVTTGISAADRAHTARILADPAATAAHLSRPGHVVPLRARDGGVLERPGHTEAAVDFARLAGRSSSGVICEVVSEEDPTTMARTPELRRIADEHDLALVSIDALRAWRRRNETQVEQVAAASLPVPAGNLTAIGFRDSITGVEHVALVAGELAEGRFVGPEPVLARLHSECLTGDVFHSLRCDCGAQLEAAVEEICAAGRGVIVYLRGHEGRGIGIAAKLAAYHLQDGGTDTVDANLELGLPADARDYSVAAQILRELGAESVRLITNNPKKVSALELGGIVVSERVPSPVNQTPENTRYLQTKRDRMGHLLQDLADGEERGNAR